MIIIGINNAHVARFSPNDLVRLIDKINNSPQHNMPINKYSIFLNTSVVIDIITIIESITKISAQNVDEYSVCNNDSRPSDWNTTEFAYVNESEYTNDKVHITLITNSASVKNTKYKLFSLIIVLYKFFNFFFILSPY